MGLSCSCGDYDGDGWYYYGLSDYKPLRTKTRRRCCSCKQPIAIGALCTEVPRFRSPADDIEERIHGDEVPMASKWMCEECSDIFLSLEELGYCVSINDDMHDLLEEYKATHAPAPTDRPPAGAAGVLYAPA